MNNKLYVQYMIKYDNITSYTYNKNQNSKHLGKYKWQVKIIDSENLLLPVEEKIHK